MAKRRKLAPPTADKIDELEAEFRRETSPRTAMAPIAQVAAEAAAEAPVVSAEERVERARDSADAEALREAEAEGRMIRLIALEEIDETTMVRDRAQIFAHELEELKLSIAASGLRLPIEVYPLTGEDVREGKKYGLISGYRRLLAMRGLAALDPGKHGRVKALVRAPQDSAAAISAMVEENEIRAALSPFERGRIAVIAAQNGAFTNVEEAVERLFAHASKAKRSKVRSYARVFESLGDLIAFPEGLTEKQGLRVAAAIRAGAEGDLREALDAHAAEDAGGEWNVMERVVRDFEDRARDPARGGRPKKRADSGSGRVLETGSGVRLRRIHDGKGYAIRFEGKRADVQMVEDIMKEVARLLDRS